MPFKHVYGFKCAFPWSNSNRKLPCLFHTDAERKTAKKYLKCCKKSKYEYANGMKNQPQSHCRLVEHICKADFSLKTCKQDYEYQLGWSRNMNIVPCWLLPEKRCSAAGRWRLVATTASAFTIFSYFLFLSHSIQILPGSLGATQFPLPHNQKSGIKESWRALMFMYSIMSGKLLADTQVDMFLNLYRQNRTICTGSSKSSSITLTSHWGALYSSINNPVKPAKRTGSGPRQGKQIKKEQKHQSSLPAEIKSLSLTSYQV